MLFIIDREIVYGQQEDVWFGLGKGVWTFLLAVTHQYKDGNKNWGVKHPSCKEAEANLEEAVHPKMNI